MKTFAEMLEVIEQHKNGLVTTAEMILQLQLDQLQAEAAVTFTKLPGSVQQKVSLADWDEQIEDARARIAAEDEANL